MGTLLNDLRFAVRLLARTPALTLVAVLSLGLGIGANTAIFTLINEVFLRPMPLRDPSRLVGIFTTVDACEALAQLLRTRLAK